MSPLFHPGKEIEIVELAIISSLITYELIVFQLIKSGSKDLLH